jgi:hypothetical protein
VSGCAPTRRPVGVRLSWQLAPRTGLVAAGYDDDGLRHPAPERAHLVFVVDDHEKA